ncbi:MAG: hypothetical protein UU12_C0007G0008 [Candidatus Woesebacteria bacterium GW2011_GWA2_40_7b]|uniref:Uncharacterized protein n=1 Tax=Candidatus Woesebacteria bacterium GW2011_GWA2_40_7b TaxID=1618563 RepID=A0A0G0W7F7_9BACT|nr:MAG: hypothetical protein UU12_C0007G0008 [Candidatus Woesebacteria bacterium GW2011_GWA2_40_7b]
MTAENRPHFGLGHFCAGCPLSNVLHKDCPMVVVKDTRPETTDEAPTTSRSGYLLPTLRRERNPSEAKNSSLQSASSHSRCFAKGDKQKDKPQPLTTTKSDLQNRSKF